MPITRRFTVYTNAGVSVPPVIHVNQYDRGETWIFTLLEPNGSQYIPASGGIVGIKADGHAIINTATVNSNGEVVVSETQQMTAAAGKAVYEIIFDNSTHGTANFIVCVEPKPGDNATLSDSDLSLIQEAIESTIPANIEASVQDWMDDNLAPAEWVIDNTLSIAGAAADAKKVGDVTSELKTNFSLNVFGDNYNSAVNTVTRGAKTIFSRLFLAGGYTYTISIDFGHQIGSAFEFEVTSGNDVIASKTIGVQSTTGELSFTAENDTYADFKYLTTDTTTTSFTYTVSVERGLSNIVENIKDNDLAIQRINQYGGMHTIEKDGLRYGVANKIFEFFATAKAVYKFDITLNQALSRNTLVRIADEDGNYVAVFQINAGWQSQTFYYVNADQGLYTIELYTADQGISSVSIVITTIGTEAKLSERIDTTRALFGNEKNILSTTGSSTTVNQFITFPCRLRHGYTYLCVVSSTSAYNRFACMKGGPNTWITQMLTNPLSDHEFSFIAEDDYTAFALYNTTACDYSIQI